MIQRLLIANRGEIARRIIRTCRRLGIEAVAVFSDADAYADFVTDADYAIGLGGNTPAESYLRGDAIVAAAAATGADAVHPGYGFLAENSEFAQAVMDLGFHVGIGGTLTFKNGGVPEAIADVPLDRIVLETDAPFLAPVPHRGKRNEPAYTRLVAEKLAELRGMTVEEVAAVTTTNARKLFKLGGVKTNLSR